MTIHLKIKRQDGPDSQAYWEHFEISDGGRMSVIDVLQEIRKRPVNADGKAIAPVVWESGCLMESCGLCTMVINGRPRQACMAFIDELRQPIRLEPLRKFPVLRDLIVDRSRILQSFQAVKDWQDIDGLQDIGAGPRMAPEKREVIAQLSDCIACGLCLEACPQYGHQSDFLGAAAIAQARRANLVSQNVFKEAERNEALMQKGGLEDCGNAQNCVASCPKDIPLTRAIAQANRAVVWHSLKRFFHDPA